MATFIVPVRIKDPKNKANMLGCSSLEMISKVFKKHGHILWMHKKNYPKYQKGDIIYMYMGDPLQVIQFNARVEDVKVQATAEELQDYTWLTQEDREKQIQNNCNDKFVFVKEMEEGERSCLTLNKLKENGFENFQYGKPMDITDKVDLIGYIESVING